ncbi:MAG TPA: hypothetical protein VHC22_16285 [Pirellulales bacterium]|nr:hypothetical protein [Pirellulales bacterium]
MDIQQFVNDWWPLIVAVFPFAALVIGPPIMRAITLPIVVGALIYILRQQKKKTANPVLAEVVGKAA